MRAPMALRLCVFPMITIAGSGPSTKEYGQRVTVATKKRSLPSDYIVCRFHRQWLRWGKEETPLMLYYTRCRCGNCSNCSAYHIDGEYWDNYYRKNFAKTDKPPSKSKCSHGLCAVFAVIERWEPETIGLIGFDWILDGNPKWGHDAQAEKACILSLVNVKDLRNDSLIRRIRS